MRIGLLQTRVRRRGRSANLTHLLRRVMASAEMVPAPDMLVLPGACDGLEGDRVTEAMTQGFGESLGAAAREWGLLIAAGLGGVDDGAGGPVALLYDADGDVVGRAGAGDVCRRETPVGHLGIGLDLADAPFVPPDQSCDLLLVLGCWMAKRGQGDAERDRLRRRLVSIAAQSGSAVCAVGAVADPDDTGGRALVGGSGLFGVEGHCVVSATTQTEETVVGQIDTVAGSGV